MSVVVAPESTTGRAPVRAPGALPLLGHGLRLLLDPLGFFTGARELGDVVAFGFGPRTAYMVNKIELVRQVLVTDAQRFHKGPMYDEIRSLLGNGLGLSEGSFHLRQRHLIQPAFHPSRIARYVTIMHQVAVDQCASWRHGQRLLLDREMFAASFQVIGRSLFSAAVGADLASLFERNLPPVLQAIARRSVLSLGPLDRLPTPGNRRVAAAAAELQDAVDRVIAERRAHGALSAGAEDLLDQLLAARGEDGSGMSDRQIRDEVVSLMIAGSETTAHTLGWLFHVLGTQPVIERRVHAELDDVLGDWDGGAAALRRLHYLPRVVQEVMRLYPVIWMFNRQSRTEVTLGGYRLPAGSLIFFSPYALQRDPEIFPDPERFDPDRWLDGPTLSAARAALLPFGAGSYKCIGESFALTEVLTVAAAIAGRWRLAPTPGRPVRPRPRVALAPSQLSMIALSRPPAAPT